MKRILFIISVCLIGSGLLIMLISLASCGFDFDRIENKNTVNEAYTVSDDFTDITIDDDTGVFNIKIEKAAIDKPQITYIGSEDITLSREVNNGKLTISSADARGFFGKMFSFDFDAYIILTLPEKSYGDIKIKTSIGDIRINGVTAKSLDAMCASGEVDIYGSTLETLSIQTASGDVSLNSLTASGAVSIDLASGDVEISNSTLGSLFADGASGDYDLEALTVIGKLEIEVGSGDIEFSRCDAGEIVIDAGSGDIEGSLLTPKNFNVHSSSGKVRVPTSSQDGGKCTIKTGSGDIEISIGAGVIDDD